MKKNQKNKIEPMEEIVELKNKEGKSFWKFVGIGVLLMFLIILLSSILQVGSQLARIHPYVEYGFYLLCAILIYFLIVQPLLVIVLAPTISIQNKIGKKMSKRKRNKNMKKIAKNILKVEIINEKEKLLLEKSFQNGDLNNVLVTTLNGTIKQKINKIIFKNARTVMVSTAISQNGRLDMVAVVTINLKMIKEMVLTCGFRPSYANLGKLSANVFGTALIAEGLEGLDFNEIFPNSFTSMLKDLPFVKPIMSSLMQGVSNALLTIRIGVITRLYLFDTTGDLTKSKMRFLAIKESVKLLPFVIKESLNFFPSALKNIFKFKENETYFQDYEAYFKDAGFSD